MVGCLGDRDARDGKDVRSAILWLGFHGGNATPDNRLCDLARARWDKPERGMNPRIVGTAGPFKGKALALTDEEISVGRDLSNKLWAADSAMSRRHCAIVQQEDGQTL